MEASVSHPRRRGLIGILVGLAVVAVIVVGVVAVNIAGDEGSARAATPTTTTIAENPLDQWPTTTAPVTTAGPQLPQPENAPEDAYADVPVVDIGTIRIPKIGLEHTVYEGVWLTVLDEGPGHWPGSAMPGGYGNTVFGGHRVTHSRPFRNVDQLVAGDEIFFDTAVGTSTYRVTEVRVVQPEETWIVDQTPGYRMTLFACHPPGSAAQRIVVFGELATA